MVENYISDIVCDYCFTGSGSDIYIDAQHGEVVCTFCGGVFDNYIYMQGEIYEK